MPLPQNFGTSAGPPSAVDSVPEDVSHPPPGGRRRSATTRENNGKVPAVRRPLPTSNGGTGSNDDGVRTGPGFGSNAYSTLHQGYTPADGHTPAAAPPGPPKRQHAQVCALRPLMLTSCNDCLDPAHYVYHLLSTETAAVLMCWAHYKDDAHSRLIAVCCSIAMSPSVKERCCHCRRSA